MNIHKAFRNLTQKLPKKALVAIAGIGVAGISFAAVQAEFYPARPTFDYNKAPLNGSSCTEADNAARNRCGSMTGPVFNSFINTPSYGDERAFVDGRRSDKATNTNADQINDVTNGSREVVIRMYVHNNANQNTNASGVGVAKDAKVRVALPTATSQVLRARGYISASNAAQVEDTTDMVGAEAFSVSYVPGSAKALRGTSSYALSDSIVTTGAAIGHTTMDGNLPGCFDHATLVELKVKVNVPEKPKIDLTKQVRKHVAGQTGNWSEEVTVKPGETVDYLINTKNTGTSDLTDVVTRDVLPPHMQVVAGSVAFYKGSTNQTLADGPLFSGGFNSGLYNGGNNTMITFSAKALGNFDNTKCEVRVRNVAFAKSAQTPTEVQDYADVVIKKDDCKEPPKSSYDCKNIRIQVLDLAKRQIRVTTNVTYQNATVKYYSYEFGDGNKIDTTDKNTVDHTYSKDGTFVVRVKVAFDVNGKTEVVESNNCVGSITFKPDVCPYNPNLPVNSPECKAPESCPIPGKEHLPKNSPECKEAPKELPNTGAGNIIGLFLAVATASAAAYQVVVRKNA